MHKRPVNLPINLPTIHPVAAWIFTLIILFAGLGAVPLFDKDEGAFAEASREMLESGNYVMTYLNGEPRYDKPVLIYWFQVLSMKLFGVNEFAVRLPSALAGLAWFAAVYRFTLKMFGRESAVMALIVLATSLQISTIAKAAIADALLNACIAIALFAFWNAAQGNDKRSRYVAWVAMAVGFLTKGPLALMIPIGTMIVFGIWEKRWREVLARCFGFGPVIVFLVIAVPWYAVAYIDQGQALLDAYYQQTIGRITSPMEGHGGSNPLWYMYYFYLIPIGLLPFTVPFFQVVRSLRDIRRAAFARFAFGCLLFNLVFWTISSTKLPHYAIYGYTPIVVLIAQQVARYSDRELRLALIPAIAVCGLFAIVPLILPIAGVVTDDVYALAVIEYAGGNLGALMPIGAILAAGVIAACAFLKRGSAPIRCCIAAAAFGCMIHFAVMPAAGRVMQQPVKEAAAYARHRDLDVVLYEFAMPSFLFYRQALCEDRFPKRGEAFIAKAGATERLEPFDTLYEQGGIIIGRRQGP